MAHGGPDWGIGVPVSTIFGIDDLGELAVRLGSIVSFDRRGNVVFLSSFEDSLSPFFPVPGGVGSKVEVVNDSSRNGAYSCLLMPGNLKGDKASLEHYSPLPVSSKLGIEISFTVNPDIAWLGLAASLDNGVETHIPDIEYRCATDKLVYYDEHDNAVILASDLKLKSGFWMFHTLKLVFDYAKQEYCYIILNETTYPLSGIKYRTEGTGGSKYFEQWIGDESNVNGLNILYIDDLIITQNEP